MKGTFILFIIIAVLAAMTAAAIMMNCSDKKALKIAGKIIATVVSGVGLFIVAFFACLIIFLVSSEILYVIALAVVAV